MRTATFISVFLSINSAAASQQPMGSDRCTLCQDGVQQVVPQKSPFPPPTQMLDYRSGENKPVASAVTAGAVGGVLGAVVLGWVGYQLGGGGRICGDDPCGLLPGALGLILGEMIGVGLGVHLGNGARGSLGTDIAVAIGAPFALAVVSAVLNDDMTAAIVIGGQIAITVAVERSNPRSGPRFRIRF